MLNDYYIVATKDGYDPYTSPTISVGQEIVHWDFKMSPITSGVTRLAGQSRVDTALAIAKAEYPRKVTIVILATADNFPDALAGSVYASNQQAPIILVGGSLPDQVINYLRTKKLSEATIFGGEAVVSQDVEQQLGQLVGK